MKKKVNDNVLCVARSSTPGLGAGLDQIEVTNFIPWKHHEEIAFIKVTARKGKYHIGQTYRVTIVKDELPNGYTYGPSVEEEKRTRIATRFPISPG